MTKNYNKSKSNSIFIALVIVYVVLYLYLLMRMISGIFVPINMLAITFFQDSKFFLDFIGILYFIFPLLIIALNYLLLKKHLKISNKKLSDFYVISNIVIILLFIFVSEIKLWLFIPSELASQIGKDIVEEFYQTQENYITDYFLMIIMLFIFPGYINYVRKFLKKD